MYIRPWGNISGDLIPGGLRPEARDIMRSPEFDMALEATGGFFFYYTPRRPHRNS